MYDLTIKIKVVKEAIKEDNIYLTTHYNVLELIKGSTHQLINVNLMGTTDPNTIYTWNNTNTNVCSITASGKEAYIKPLDVGIASVKVTNSKALYELTIVIIVKEPVKTNNLIITEQKIVTMKPGQTNKELVVSLSNGIESDKKDFVWSIYKEDISKPEDALKGGNVVTLVSGAEKALVNAHCTGISTIRVDHPKTEQSIYIVIYVTDYTDLAFSYESIEIAENETEFIEVQIPNHTNYEKTEIVYTVDNPEICTAVGTNKVCLIQAKNTGLARIMLRIKDTDQEAILYVTVKKAEVLLQPRIVTNSNVIALTPRSSSQTITANLVGLNVTDIDQDEITWSINNTSVVDMYPVVKKGREINIIPKLEGEAIITIKHSKSPMEKKIFVKVAEVDNAFKLEKNNLIMESGFMEYLSSTIESGKTADYENIAWSCTKLKMADGTYEDIIRIMGTGKTVQVYAIRSGTSIITAFYKGILQTCIVTVTASKHFNLTAKTITVYPGQTMSIPYEVKPTNSNIVWYTSEQGATEPVFEYTDVYSTNELSITGLKEGIGSISGLANGIKSTIQIKCAWDYNVTGDYSVTMAPTEVNKEINYTIYPPITKLEVENSFSDYILVDIKPADPKTGKGKIYINTLKECKNKELIFKQYKEDGTSTGKSFKTYITSFYKDEKYELKFLRYDGYWGNNQNRNWNNPSASKIEILPVENGMKTVHIGDGETHYIILDKQYDNSNLKITNTPSKPFDVNTVGAWGYKLVDLEDGRRALVISGGKDYIVEDRVAIFYDIVWRYRQRYCSSVTGTQVNSSVQYTPNYLSTPTYTYNLTRQKGDMYLIPVGTSDMAGGAHCIVGFGFILSNIGRRYYPTYLDNASSIVTWDRFGTNVFQHIEVVSPSKGYKPAHNLLSTGSYRCNTINGRYVGEDGKDYGLKDSGAEYLYFDVSVTVRSTPHYMSKSAFENQSVFYHGYGIYYYNMLATHGSHLYTGMPSISTGIHETQRQVISITYTNEADDTITEKVQIVYERRACHKLFNPNKIYYDETGYPCAVEIK